MLNLSAFILVSLKVGEENSTFLKNDDVSSFDKRPDAEEAYPSRSTFVSETLTLESHAFFGRIAVSSLIISRDILRFSLKLLMWLSPLPALLFPS